MALGVTRVRSYKSEIGFVRETFDLLYIMIYDGTIRIMQDQTKRAK